MFRRAAGALLPALAVWLAAALPAAAADGPPVSDAAGLYSPAVVQKAADEIRGIERAEHRDLVIETFAAVPAAQEKEFRNLSGRRARDEFFTRWAKTRAAERRVDGVYVLICKHPRTAVALLGPGTEERVFPARDRERLAEDLLPGRWRQNHDQELLGAVTWFHSALHHNLVAGSPEDPGRIWPAALAVIAGLLLVWGALALALRAVCRLRPAGPADAPDAVPARTGEGLTPEPVAPAGAFVEESGGNELERRARDG
jgi:uncharacterized membrane protein YgcG